MYIQETQLDMVHTEEYIYIYTKSNGYMTRLSHTTDIVCGICDSVAVHERIICCHGERVLLSARAYMFASSTSSPGCLDHLPRK